MCGAETDGATDRGRASRGSEPHTHIVIAHYRSSALAGTSTACEILSIYIVVSHLVQQANEILFGVCCALL